MTDKLSQQAFEQACDFVLTHGRPLDAERIRHFLSGDNAEGVIAALMPFQNTDGGFGHAIEPDLRTPASTAIATSIGLGILSKLGVGSDHAMVRQAMGYLVATVDTDRAAWPIINADVGLAPHAPWWTYSDELAEGWNQFRFNPTAELLRYCYEYHTLVPGDLLNALSVAMAANLAPEPPLDSIYDIRCCLALHQTPDLPDGLRQALAIKLKQSAAALAPDDPHANFFELVPKPESLLAEVVAQPFEAYVKKMILAQQDDGSWAPWWDWSKVSAEGWQLAERDWRGSLTLGMVEAFRSHELVE